MANAARKIIAIIGNSHFVLNAENDTVLIPPSLTDKVIQFLRLKMFELVKRYVHCKVSEG